MASPSIVVSYGMGVDSTALVLRWVFEPSTRPGPLEDMLVVTAMTGDEYPRTGELVERHVLPLFRQHGIRYAQVARGGQLAETGLVVLDDSRLPTRVHLYDGPWSLSTEMRAAGTVPQVGGSRRCSIHAKGEVIDPFIRREVPGPYLHVLGFEAEEAARRASKDAKHNTETRTGVYPLIEWGWNRARCAAYIRDRTGEDWPKSACYFCLAGETEVVTREGIRPIGALAGEEHELLVPRAGAKGGLATRGTWKRVAVRSFGVQQLYRVELRRGRSVKTVFATAEHRWVLAPVPGAQWVPAGRFWTITSRLRPGDSLRSLQAAPPGRERMMPFAVAQGFVYGDGTLETSGCRRYAAMLQVYDNGKDQAMLPFFMTCEPQRTAKGWRVHPLPRAWKRLPDLSESRSFLLSWLSGYFAADGTVSASGVPTLYSADRASIEAARNVAALCGVGYTPIRSRERLGFGAHPTALWQINLRTRDLPAWFFHLAEHRRRAERLVGADEERQPWRVMSVEETQREEEVFCAVVPGTTAFGLADDLMTGNCPFALTSAEGPHRALDLYAGRPQAAVDALLMEHVARSLNPLQGLAGEEKFLADLLAADPRQEPTLREFGQLLDGAQWRLYEVRRAWVRAKSDPSKTRSLRSLRSLDSGSRAAMAAALKREAATRNAGVDAPDGISRAWVLRRGKRKSVPDAEHLLVAAPAGAADKQLDGFEDAFAYAVANRAPTLF